MMIDVDPEHVPCSYDTITVQQPLAAAVLLLVAVGMSYKMNATKDDDVIIQLSSPRSH